MGQMLETFEANLAAAQKQEQENQKDFEALRTAKKAEIAAGKAQIQQKGTEKADTDEKNAQAKIDLDETENSLSADEKFLRMLKEKCSLTDKDWNERQKTRRSRRCNRPRPSCPGRSSRPSCSML